MAEFYVMWAIDVSADTPRDAALKAAGMMPCPDSGSLATFFEVRNQETDETTIIDIEEEDRRDSNA